MKPSRTDPIIDAAMALADAGGFDHVRQRDVAARAGVALRTLYKRFGSKEELLAAGLASATLAVERRLAKTPAPGETPEARLTALFAVLTRALTRRPNLARAMIRSMASGVPGVAAHVVAHQTRIAGLVLAALGEPGALAQAGSTGAVARASLPTSGETALSLLLLQVWFAGLVGWSAELFSVAEVDAQMAQAIRWLLRGQAADGSR